MEKYIIIRRKKINRASKESNLSNGKLSANVGFIEERLGRVVGSEVDSPEENQISILFSTLF